MSGFGMLLRKELLEAWRTRRLPVVAVLFLVVGIMSPLTARYLNEILTFAMGDQLPIALPAPTATMALEQLQKNIGQLGSLAAIALAMGSVSGELDRGTAAMVLAQPVGRPAFLAAKLLAIAVVLGIATLLASAVAWIYTAILFEPLPVGGWLAMTGLSWLALTCWAAVTFLASAATGSTMAAAGIGFVALIGLSLVAIVPVIDRFLPTGLTVPAIAPGGGQWSCRGRRASRDGRRRLAGAGGRLPCRGDRHVPAPRAVAPIRSIPEPRRAMHENGALAGAVRFAMVRRDQPGRASGAGLALQAALEALDLAGGVDDVLLARVERVAVAADVHAQLLTGGAELEVDAARAAVDLRLVVLGMGVGLHEGSSGAVRAGHARRWSPLWVGAV